MKDQCKSISKTAGSVIKVTAAAAHEHWERSLMGQPIKMLSTETQIYLSAYLVINGLVK